MHAYGALAIDTIGYGNMTHKLPAILPSLPEPLSARLFGTATQHHLKAGDPLFVAGDSGDGCYRLERGMLKVVIASTRGDERILALLGPSEIAGCLEDIATLKSLVKS